MEKNNEVMRRLRLAKGLSLRDLAKKTGWSSAYLCDLEHGYRNLTHRVMVIIGRHIGAEIFTLKDVCPTCEGKAMVDVERFRARSAQGGV